MQVKVRTRWKKKAFKRRRPEKNRRECRKYFDIQYNIKFEKDTRRSFEEPTDMRCQKKSYTLRFIRSAPKKIAILIINQNLKQLLISICLGYWLLASASNVTSSLIIGDSAIEIQELDGANNQRQASNVRANEETPPDGSSIVLGKTQGNAAPQSNNILSQADSILSNEAQSRKSQGSGSSMPSPLPPLDSSSSSSSKGSSRSSMSNSREPDEDSRTISGRVVDFELIPAGGHNKATVKKKKKKKKMEEKEEKQFKKWDKKKKAEKEMGEMKHKEGMKKKKEEG